jgi:hypothetical protein
VQRRDQHAAPRVQRPAAADPDGSDLSARIVRRLPPEREEPPQAVLVPTSGLGRRDDEALDLTLRVDDPGGELCSADVEPECGRSYPFVP